MIGFARMDLSLFHLQNKMYLVRNYLTVILPSHPTINTAIRKIKTLIKSGHSVVFENLDTGLIPRLLFAEDGSSTVGSMAYIGTIRHFEEVNSLLSAFRMLRLD